MMITLLESDNKKNKQAVANTIAALYDEKYSIPEYIRGLVLVRLIWATTENKDDGAWKKYEGQPYWSIGALKKVIENTNKNLPYSKDLRHEHSVPKKEIIARIDESNKTKGAIFKILDELGHAVVITKEEDTCLNKAGLRSKMPIELQENNNIQNVFSRYLKAGIKVCYIPNIEVKQINQNNFPDLIKNVIT